MTLCVSHRIWLHHLALIILVGNEVRGVGTQTDHNGAGRAILGNGKGELRKGELSNAQGNMEGSRDGFRA